MGDVALVPQGHVLEGGLRIGADHTGETGDLLAGDGVAFVGHGGGALLYGGKRLGGFADFGALKMADLDGDFVEAGSNASEHGEVVGVEIAREDLRGDGRGLETETSADFFFGFGADVGEGPDRSRDFADADLFGGLCKAGFVAAELVVPERDFKAEGDRLGVHAVGAADLHRVFMLEGELFESGEQLVEISGDEARGVADLQRLCGIDDVIRGEAVMQPAGGVGVVTLFHALGDGGGEGDDVVAYFALDFLDTGEVETGVGAQAGGGFLRYIA